MNINSNLISFSGKIGSGKDLALTTLQFLTCNDDELKQAFIEKPIECIENYLGLQTINSSYKNTKYSRKVKVVVAELLNVTTKKLEDKEYINTELGPEWWVYVNEEGTRYSYKNNELDEYQISFCRLIKYTPRLLMQVVGTEAGRDFIHPDIWVNSTFGDYDGVEKRANTDCRFWNEFRKIKSFNGIVFRLVRVKSLQEWVNTFELDEFIDVYDNPKIKDFEFTKMINDIENFSTVNDPDFIKIKDRLNHESETGLDNCDEFDEVIYNDGTIIDFINKLVVLFEKYGIIDEIVNVK